LWRLGAFAMFLCLPFFHFWQTRLWPVWVGQALAVLVVLWVALASSPWMFAVALFLGGMTLGFNYQCSIFFTLTEMTEKGKGSGVHEATLGGGMFLGPILAGWVGQSEGSLRAPYYFCAGFLLLWIFVQMAIVVWRRRDKTACRRIEVLVPCFGAKLIIPSPQYSFIPMPHLPLMTF